MGILDLQIKKLIKSQSKRLWLTSNILLSSYQQYCIYFIRNIKFCTTDLRLYVLKSVVSAVFNKSFLKMCFLENFVVEAECMTWKTGKLIIFRGTRINTQSWINFKYQITSTMGTFFTKTLWRGDCADFMQLTHLHLFWQFWTFLKIYCGFWGSWNVDFVVL